MSQPKSSFVYILASQRNGTLYTGVTSDLTRRAWQHRSKDVQGFTKQYNVCKLVYFENHGDINEVIKREKQIKRWSRNWEKAMIERDNPHWEDLYLKMVE